ncbi:outer membrane lipoprotein-sorting protein [Pseudodesulfovibrio sp. F-1]|uniref:Outer membrane lipoprotein-sorting protein n=1 Tax=Pseudodesulfovibrio alkaliphilus TaxID=2661613 RepID=A0A7K1KR04_9BACT|nr:outer membrane lipoprotein-sorting protein [Pseudodesulfovibrio alkaliphilus]MUM78507.1 outer membrane lipoprotein-sorting protein [Pseudodesulfovibrio alkaliphilus]
MKKRLMLLAIVVSLLSFAAAVQADAMDGDAIVRRANHVSFYQGETCKGNVNLIITDAQGRNRQRELNILRMNLPGEDRGQKYLAFFKSPADVRKMVFLVHKTVEPGQDDSRWLYMPGLDLVKRIAAGDKRTSFAGSDFLYEDISGRNLDEDRHERMEDRDGLLVVANTPKVSGGVEFTHYLAFVDPLTFIPLRVEYYKDDRVYRIMEVLRVEDVPSGDSGGVYPTVTRSRVTNLETGSSTVMTFSGVSYGVSIEERIFSERYLRRPPQEVMR